MLLSIFSRLLSKGRRYELSMLSALVIISGTTIAANAQTASSSYYYQDQSMLEVKIQQTNVTIADDKRLQQQYIEQINSLKAELGAAKKTASNAAKIAQIKTQLTRAQQVESTLATNVSNLSQWVEYWQQKESADKWNEDHDSLDRVAANVFDLDGDRESPNERNANAQFAADQAAHDARLPSLRHYNTWEN